MKKWLPVLIMLAGLGNSISAAQYVIVDCIVQKKLVVPRVKGQVFDATGVPVPDTVISLKQGENQELIATTDSQGRFDFKVQSGPYNLKASHLGFESTTAELEVGRDLLSLFHPTALRVILSLPGFNCPWVTTSNKEFKELAHIHATQK
jgi:hypothetical protein